MSDQTDMREPRRYTMPSELDDDERAATQRFGASGQIERAEYREWRERMLDEEHDNLKLRGRVLEEQAEVLRTRAADQKTDALGKLTAEDWGARMAEEGKARETGTVPEPLDDGGAAGLEADAAELEREAEEIAQFLAETRDAA